MRFPRRHLATLLPVLPVLAFFLAVTLGGLDFGFHWDESHGHQRPVRLSLERGTAPLPGYYIYPSLNYAIDLGVLLPEGFAAWWRGEPVRPALLAALASDAWTFRQRAVRAVLSSLAVLWLYLLALALGRSRLEAWLAAALLALSWEFAYHARWPAPDTVMVQFGLLSLLAAVMSLRQVERRRWPLLAAAAAALACATKYPAGLFLIAALVALALRPAALPWRQRWRSFAGAARGPLLVFVGVFLAVVPGAVLEMRLFVQQLRYMTRLYSRSNAFYANISVEPGLAHLADILAYLGRLALAPWVPLALALAACAVPGVVALARGEDRWRRRAAWLVLGFPVVYALYFCRQRIMVVRNYQVLIPFLALFAAVGLVALVRRLPGRWPRAAVAVAVAAALLANAGWAVAAVASIRARRDHGRVTAELAAYLDEHRDLRFALSPRTADRLQEAGLEPPPGALLDTAREAGGGHADAVVCHLLELGDPFPSNLVWGGFSAVFGPREVDLDVYTTWRGDDRPLVLSWERARELGLVLPQRIRRRLVFAPAPAGPRALVRTGDDHAFDLLTVALDAEGAAVFALEQEGDARRWLLAKAPPPIRETAEPPFVEVEEAVAVEAGRPYALEVSWDVYGGRVEVRLDGRLVFARRADLVRYRLDELRVELP